MKYVLGTKIGKVDGLSRRQDYKIGVENNNKNQRLIKKRWVWELVRVVVEEPEVDIMKKKIAGKKDKKVVGNSGRNKESRGKSTER